MYAVVPFYNIQSTLKGYAHLCDITIAIQAIDTVGLGAEVNTVNVMVLVYSKDFHESDQKKKTWGYPPSYVQYGKKR